MTTADHGTVDLAAEAYVWGLPLVTMHRTRALSGLGARLGHRRRLSNAADRDVVAPNNDTLYSSGWFDLSAGDLVIDVDAMDRADRYWSVMLLDAYTNVSYVSRRCYGSEGASVRVIHEPTGGPAPSDPSGPDAVVRIGTPTVWALVRVLVSGHDDLASAWAAQDCIRVAQPPGVIDGPPIVTAAGVTAPPAQFFTDLRAALAIDPPAPWHPPVPAGVSELLDALPPADALAAAVASGERRIAAHGLGADRQQNGWGTRQRGADFGRDVLYRAAFTKFSLAGHLPAENRSYSRALDGGGPVRLRFPPGGDPPVGAFWSLTVYGPDLFFVDNELDRYSIGDRTAGVQRDADGSLTILVGHDRPAETCNWLPAPAGRCFLSLRAYEGLPPVVDAEWFPPDLEPVAVVTAGTPR